MTTSLLTRGTFFFPGPTEVRAPVLEAMARPMIPHRGKEFETMFAGIQAGLATVFGTTRPVYVSSSSATGLMEAGIRCAPAGAVLAVVNGAFSARFAAIARACGRETTVLDLPWGSAATPEAVGDALRAGRFAVVTVVHSETSTGALTDVRAVTRVARAHGAACLVDSVTGVGGAELRFDEWELDYALTGSQKALAMPPGLAFAAATTEFIARAAQSPSRGLYFDLVEFDAYAARHQTPNTPAIPLLFAAEAQLRAIVEEGMPARWARHLAMAERTHAWIGAMRGRHGESFGVLAARGGRSPSVTSMTLPETMPSSVLLRAVKERGFTIGSGYGQNKETTVRFGHMGDHTVEGLDRCLAACGDALDALLA